eukprot:CAMPEP_0176009826 /NCGR_PEP_ID=MMETSP0120_2-20121206/4450_1 /TAXON_ID=160619 /ORGANISM="Kryptoperidinium foliaceum, Strain CCMP 1326" /LENGTH=214 /DNA_ID=CAMNT_0017342633 /DNA_START=65 /DNA_END=706 /DNA_ORIENTATION=+
MKTFHLIFALVACLASCLLRPAEAVDADRHDNCEFWAESGECDKNPGYMQSNCAASCDRVAKQALADAKELESIGSFFDLSAYDIHGNLVEFSKFEGQVTIIVNVASQCGYTDSHYKGLVKLWSQVKHSGNVNILAFPCNQFGAQESGSNEDIHLFALGYGVEFQMMSKINVNGPDASIVYKYLKKMAGPSSIGWNFATYYIVSPDGTVESHSG